RLEKEAQAVEFYQDCLKFKNFLQLPRQRLAAIYFKNGQIEKTINEYEKLRGEYPDDIPSLVILGHLYMAAKQYEKATDAFNTAILIHPDNFIGRDEEIEALVAQDQLHDAIDLLETKLQSDPDNLELLVRRGDIFSMLAETTEAAESYKHVTKLCPDMLEPTIKLGTQYLQMQNDELAARQFNLAFEINDRVVDAYIGLATSQKLSGNINEATGTLSLAAAIQPNSAILFTQAACLQFHCGLLAPNDYALDNEPSPRMVAAIKAHQEQLSIEPSNPDVYYRLGLLLLSMGNYEDSSKAFHTALNINPTFDRARSKLAVCLFELGQKDKALDLLESSQILDAKTLELHYQTAMLYCDKLKFASSLMNLDHLMQDTFTKTSTTHNVSVVLQNLGLLDRAVATWENLVDTANALHSGLDGPDTQEFAS
ncbi:MAG: tetratricopeptide repeat protein, partial [Phycisphaerae bacterium]